MLDILKKELAGNSTIERFMGELPEDNHANIWADSFLYDLLPFDMEIHRIKRAKIFKSTPKNRAYKTNNIVDRDNMIIAAFSYIPNWDEPSDCLFVKNNESLRYIYRFDINRVLTTVSLQEYKDNRLQRVFSLNKSGNFTVASVQTDENIIIELHTGLDINKMDNMSNSVVIVDYKTADTIEIVREDSGKQPYAIYSGTDPYRENQIMTPLYMHNNRV